VKDAGERHRGNKIKKEFQGLIKNPNVIILRSHLGGENKQHIGRWHDIAPPGDRNLENICKETREGPWGKYW